MSFDYLWIYLCVFLGSGVLFIRVLIPFLGVLADFFNHPTNDSMLLRSGMPSLSLFAAVSLTAIGGAVYLTGIIPDISLLTLILLCAAVPAAKLIILYLIRTVSGGKEPMAAIMCLTLIFLVFLSIIIVTASVILYLYPACYALPVHRTVFFALCGILLCFYLIKVTGLFLATGIHVFCTFLYLCTLEYLPVGLLTVMLIRY